MNIVATILETYRPDLLRRTLDSSREDLLRCAQVIAFCNGGDGPSMMVLDECGIPHDRIVHSASIGSVVPNGPATSICAAAARESGCEYWWHLEGDWTQIPELVARHPTWLADTVEIASNPAIGQVRLREEAHLGRLVTLPDGVHGDGSGASNTNWIDGRPVAWQVVPGAPFMVSAHHLTFNPFIMRTELIGDGKPQAPGEPIRGVFPAENERHAMARFYALNLLVAQLRPGIFRHIGEGRSLEGH